MTNFTIFTTCKPFTDEEAYANQWRALDSWSRLKPCTRVLLFGDDKGVADGASFFQFEHRSLRPGLHGIEVNKMIQAAETLCPDDILIAVDADILLHQSILDAGAAAAQQFDRFLLIGRRRALSKKNGLSDYEEGWHYRLALQAPLFSPDAIDYFVFTPGLWPEIPPFTVGRYAYDNWLVQNAIDRGEVVIDATSAVFAFHQEHKKQPRSGLDWQQNLSLHGRKGVGWVSHAPWIMNPNLMIRKRKTRS